MGSIWPQHDCGNNLWQIAAWIPWRLLQFTISLYKSWWRIYFVVYPIRRFPVLFKQAPVVLLCLIWNSFNWALQICINPQWWNPGIANFLPPVASSLSIDFVIHLSCAVCICILSPWCFLMVSGLVDHPLSDCPVPSRSFVSSLSILSKLTPHKSLISKSGTNNVSRSLSCSIFDFLWPPFKTSWQTKTSTYSDMVRLCHLEFSPAFQILLLTSATMPGIHIGGHMYGSGMNSRIGGECWMHCLLHSLCAYTQ